MLILSKNLRVHAEVMIRQTCKYCFNLFLKYNPYDQNPSPPVGNDRASDDESGDDDQTASETSRILTPDEIAKFRARLSVSPSKEKIHGNKLKTTRGIKRPILIVGALSIAVFALIFMKNSQDVSLGIDYLKKLIEPYYDSLIGKNDEMQ